MPNRIAFNPQDRFVVTMGQKVIVIDRNGDVFGNDINGRHVGPPFKLTGSRAAFNPEDRFVLTIGNRLIVINQSGDVFGNDINGNDVGPPFKLTGSRAAFNPEDRFVVTIGSKLIVINQSGDVFGNDINGNDVGPPFKLTGSKAAFNGVEDRFVVAIANTLIVITRNGDVFGHEVHGNDVGPPFRIAGRAAFNPEDRFVVTLGNMLLVTTTDGAAFGADLAGRALGPTVHLNSPHNLAENAEELPWAVILCRFKGEAPDANLETPVATFFQGAFSPGSGGLVEYWREVSFGGVDITRSRVFNWVEVDIARINAGGIGRAALIDAAIRAAQGRGDDPLTGFHSQIAVYPHNWAKNGAPPGTDWHDPVWRPFWIDGSADAKGRVCLTPPFNGNITAHEMGHGFGMEHDVGPTLTTASDYADPACIMSQNGPFARPPWNVAFGPAVCLPHLVQKGWLPRGRLYVDDGAWMSVGATIPLAPVSRPNARANLGIRLRNVRANPAWDYYLEYCIPTDWNRGVAGSPYLLIRRMVDIPHVGSRPAYLMALPINQAVGAGASADEPSGNVRFTAEVTDLPGPILRVTAEAL